MKNRNDPREFSWKEMPMLRMLLPMATGIACGVLFREIPPWAVTAGMAAGGSGCLLLSRRKIPYRLRHAYAIACILFWISAGIFISKKHLATGRENYFMNLQAVNPVWTGMVKETGGSAFPRAIVEIEGHCDPFTRATGRALIYTEKPLEKGQILLFKADFREIPPPKNPGGFDNRRYRFYQNIHHQAYLKESDYRVTGKVAPHFLEQWRDLQVGIWKEQLKDTSAWSVATAMVLGYTAELPDEVRDTYARTGATHVLSVSGLHVGLIYLMLAGLTRKWRSVKMVRKLSFVICLAGIWGFAFLTGAGPAVLRAATMFSFVLAGRQLGRDISIFNSLAASAFFLLWINPFWLFHIGFQLSYTALAGIVVFQPLFYRLWIPSNKWLDKIWTLTTVSFGAQLATAPLTIWYFHQFPVYFWLSGLVVVPASPFIIALGILLTLVHVAAPGLAFIPAFLLKNLILLMNSVLEWMQGLPFSVLENLFLPKASIILLFAAILLLAGIWEHRRQRALPWLLCMLNAVAAARFYAETQLYFREEVIVYHVPKNTLVDYIHKGNRITLKSEKLDEAAEERAAGFYRIQRRALRVQESVLPEKDSFLKLGKFNIGLVGDSEKGLENPPLDLILLHGTPGINLKTLTAKWIIADVSNRKKAVERWKEECLHSGLNFVDIGETGAFSIRINQPFLSQ